MSDYHIIRYDSALLLTLGMSLLNRKDKKLKGEPNEQFHSPKL